MSNKVKRALAYMYVFGLTTAMAGTALVLAFYSIIGLIMFVTWSLPVEPISALFFLRLGFAIGAVSAFAFTLSKDGQEVINDAIENLDKRGY